MRYSDSAVAALAMFCLAGLLTCSSDPPTGGSGARLYPTTIIALPSDSLNNLTAQFQAGNPLQCGLLDQFGFTDRGSGLCVNTWAGIDTSASYDPLIATVYAAIITNSLYTGVLDSSDLVFERALPISDLFLTVSFRPQVYAGLPVQDHSISAWVDSSGVRILDGHFHPEIHIPDLRHDAEYWEDYLVGLEIVWYCWASGPLVFEVGEDNILPNPVLVILPVKRSDRIELRLAWEYIVGDSVSWKVLVDAMNGEILRTSQRFAC